MNKENIQKWIDALRSGNYKQGRKALHYKDQFCCLGVACDISGLGEWIGGGGSRYHIGETYGSGSFLPEEVQDWLGIREYDPTLDGRSATTLNDYDEESFDFIADAIEVQFLK